MVKKQILHKGKKYLYNASSWLVVLLIVFSTMIAVLIPHASATTSGQMKLYFHKEASDINETYNALSLTPPEPAADTAPGTLTSATNVNATPPTSFCEAGDGQTDAQNERAASAASTGNRCLGTFISMPIGNAISINTGDTNAITSQLWSSESANQAAVALNVYLYRWTGSGTTVVSGDRIATLTCAEPGTSATSCSITATPANNITFAATDRIVAIVSSNVTTLRSGADTRFYFDSTGRTATTVTLKYTALTYNTSNKPSLAGSLDDDFTAATATTACSTSGVTYNTKWTCLQGSAASTAGAFNAEDTSAAGSGDSSSWLWLRNQTTATSATVSNFGTTPSNTFIYQSMPTSYGDGDITTAVNSSATFGVGATSPSSPYNHIGLVLWTSNTDYLELQIYASGVTTGTNTVNVVMNNSGTLGTATAINSTTSSGIFGEVWLRITNTANSYQGQYSTNGTTWNNVSSSVSHSTVFTKVGLNSFTDVANPVSSYAGAFEWFKYNFANPTYNQTSYRWFANADSTTPGSSLAAQNTAYTLTSTGQQFRLRQLLHINGDLSSNSLTSITNVDSGGAIGLGEFTSIALGSDGFARISYYDGSSSLKFAQCTNADCSSENISTVDTGGAGLGQGSSMVLGSDGFARISYIDGSNSSVKFAQCTNAACSTSNINTVDTVTNGPANTSIALGSDGFARISYNGSNSLKFAQCTNAACSTSNINTVDTGGLSIGEYSSLVLGSDGFARISYHDGSNSLKFAQCTNAACSTSNINTVDTGTNVGAYTSIVLGSDGFGRISYDGTGANLKFAQCTNAACSTSNINTVDSGNNPYTSIVLGSDGFGRISYSDANIGVLKLAQCANAACSTKNISTVDSSGGTGLGQYSSITLGSDDLARISYFAGNSNGLRLYSPAKQFKLRYAVQGAGCSSATYSDITSSTAVSMYNNPTPNNGDTISYQSGTDPTESGQTITAQNYQENSNFVNTSSLSYSADGEWDFSLYDNGAPGGTTYCLEITKSDGTSLDTYTNYPIITTYSPGPTTDQVLRGGEWFSNGAKQPFFWAN